MASTTDIPHLAAELRLVLGQLIRRLRLENALPLGQARVLALLERDGPQTSSALATAERMRPQSMAQTVKDLEAAKLVVRRGDPHDRRRLLVDLTPRGRQALEDDRSRRDGWLAAVIVEHLSPDEQRTLRVATELLERLAQHAEPSARDRAGAAARRPARE